jgi:hypothetical protein
LSEEGLDYLSWTTGVTIEAPHSDSGIESLHSPPSQVAVGSFFLLRVGMNCIPARAINYQFTTHQNLDIAFLLNTSQVRFTPIALDSIWRYN